MSEVNNEQDESSSDSISDSDDKSTTGTDEDLQDSEEEDTIPPTLQERSKEIQKVSGWLKTIKSIFQNNSENQKKGKKRTILVFCYRQKEEKEENESEEEEEVPEETPTLDNALRIPKSTGDPEPSAPVPAKRVRKNFSCKETKS